VAEDGGLVARGGVQSGLRQVRQWIDLAVSSVLLAGLYATMAYGLGLIYGVLRIVNLSHAGFIMSGAYLGWVLHGRLGIDPYLSIPIVLLLAHGAGVVIYKLLVRRLPRGAAGGVQSLLLLFGVALLLRNAAYLLFTGNDQTVRTTYSTHALTVFGLSLPVNRLAVFAVAVATLVGLHLFLSRTYLGKAIRAVAQNEGSCTLVGIDVERIFSLAFGLGTALASLAGLLAGTLFSFNPSFGSVELLKSFVVVVLGGLGSVPALAAAALVLAVVESFAILVLPAYLTSAVGFVLLVLVLVLRPGGLLGKRAIG
jgi:branched-chain amino acid transport system permease protein